jgi:hypothetical protein
MYRGYLPPVPIQIAAISSCIAILTSQLAPFVPCRRIVAAIEIAPQFTPIVHYLRFIAPNVAAIAPVSIIRKHRSRTQPDH